jgi:hypothetical protein
MIGGMCPNCTQPGSMEHIGACGGISQKARIIPGDTTPILSRHEFLGGSKGKERAKHAFRLPLDWPDPLNRVVVGRERSQ